MILVVGSSSDKVYPKLVRCLRNRNYQFVTIDEDFSGSYHVCHEIENSEATFRIIGRDCEGNRDIGSIFVRHAVARTLNPAALQVMGMLQTNLNHIFYSVSCPIINLPSNAYSNYSKPYQVGILARAGFKVPKTLVTNLPEEVCRFYEVCNGQVIFKGVSNMMTFAQVLTPDKFSRLNLLPDCPTLFQEYICGVDFRIHVIGERTFVTRLTAPNEDYRRSALIDNEQIEVSADILPDSIIKKCISITEQLGLIVSGIDFKLDVSGNLVALELNPYPQFTFYGERSGQPITEAVADYLFLSQVSDTNIFA